MHRHIALTALLLSSVSLGGCASSGKTYPSIKIRQAERVSGSFEVAGADGRQTEPAPISQATLGRLPQLEMQAASAHAAFQKAAPSARQIAVSGKGAAVASERWSRAQIALGDLDSLRSQTATYLGDLDLLFVDATLAFEQREAIGKTRDAVAAMIRDEDRTLAQLRGILDN